MSQEVNIPLEDDLREEYDETFLKNGVRGKYVQRLAAGSNIVRLAPDVAAAFPTEEAVNEALRLLLRESPREPDGRVHAHSQRTDQVYCGAPLSFLAMA